MVSTREDLSAPDDEMVRFFCPRCWADSAEDAGVCPSCGLRIYEFWEPLDHVEKLIVALNHPEPNTPVRAAHLLGRIGDQRAVPALIRTVETTRDVYLARASIRALGEIGSPEAIEFLRSLTAHPAKLIGEEAERALSRREEAESAGQAYKD
jgi:HEAT repeats